MSKINLETKSYVFCGDYTPILHVRESYMQQVSPFKHYHYCLFPETIKEITGKNELIVKRNASDFVLNPDVYLFDKDKLFLLNEKMQKYIEERRDNFLSKKLN